MTFARLVTLMQAHVENMCADTPHLFEVQLDKDKLWELYLDSFPEGTNPIYRKRREYDCSCCRHFIKRFGNVVSIKNGIMTTIWDFATGDPKFQPVLDAMNKFVKAHAVCDVFYTREAKIGTQQSYEQTDDGVKEWNHFFVKLPGVLIARGNISEGDFKGGYRDSRNVFRRSLEELNRDSLEAVLELIESNTLYRGEEWKEPLKQFLTYKMMYDGIEDDPTRELFAWEQSVKLGPSITRIRNHSIGTLLVNLSEGMDLEEAVRKYELIVAPTNYKRPKAIFTKKMLEDAEKTVTELGYMESLPRRHAKLDNISVNNILFSNRDAAKQLSDGNVFASMMTTATSKPMNFDRVEEITAEDFVKKILPTASDVEVYLENRHAKNMVSLIAPQNPDAKTMFKWNNNFSWAYAGNVTDSLKENVKAAGGKVDGVLRFSIQWNDERYNPNDFDAHCVLPNHKEIAFFSTHDYTTRGELDVDVICPVKDQAAVENITWPTKAKMTPGEYRFFVHCYSNRGGRDGFKAEIEFDGQIYSFEYPHELRYNEVVNVATVTLDRNGNFTIKQHLDSKTASRDVWNLKTNNFVPVSVVMYSPNYWDEQEGIGHRHYFFMLKDCHNPENPNGFYNEFLKNDLLQHKRVFEALGARMRVEDSEDQLSGIGFSATKRDDLIVRVTGSIRRMLKIKF